MSPSLLWDRVTGFVTALQPQPAITVHVEAVRSTAVQPVQTSRVQQTERILDHTRQQLADERTRAKKWERRAVVASADLTNIRGDLSSEKDIARTRLRQVVAEKDERISMLERRLAVSEDQRTVALARLAGYAGGVEGAHEENRVLRSMARALEVEVEGVRGKWRREVGLMDKILRDTEDREMILVDKFVEVEGECANNAHERGELLERVAQLELALVRAEAEKCYVALLKEEKEQLDERVEELTISGTRLEHLEEEQGRLLEEMKQRSIALADAKSQVSELQTEISQLTACVDEKAHKAETAEQMFTEMKKEFERFRHEKDETTRQHEATAEMHKQMLLDLTREIERIGVRRNDVLNKHEVLARSHQVLADILREVDGEVVGETGNIDLSPCLRRIIGRLSDTDVENSSLRETIKTRDKEAADRECAISGLQKATTEKENILSTIAASQANLAAGMGHEGYPTDAATGVVDIAPLVAKLTETLEFHKAEAISLCSTLSSRDFELTASRKENAALQERYAKQSASFHLLETETEKLSSVVEKMQSEIVRLRGENQDRGALSDMLDLEKQRNAENVRTLGIELSHLKHEKTEVEQNLAQAKIRLEKVESSSNEIGKRSTVLEADNDALKNTIGTLREEKGAAESENDRMKDEIRYLRSELDTVREEMVLLRSSVAEERDHLVKQLSERTASLVQVEAELKDARENYIVASKNFENQQLSLTRRLSATESEALEARQRLEEANSLVDGNTERLGQFMMKRQELEAENGDLKSTASGDGDLGITGEKDVHVLRELLTEAKSESFRLKCALTAVRRQSQERRLSSSSMSSDEDMARRVAELESTLEEETKEKEASKKRLDEAEESAAAMKKQLSDLKDVAQKRETESEHLKREMSQIHSRMKKMAHVSIPKGAAELLGDEEDLRRLEAIRVMAREEVVKENKVLTEEKKTKIVTEDKKEKIREARPRVSGGKKLLLQRKRVRLTVFENTKTKNRA